MDERRIRGIRFIENHTQNFLNYCEGARCNSGWNFWIINEGQVWYSNRCTLVKLHDPQTKNITRVHTTMVMNIKPNGQFKSRVCLRGDQISFTAHRFSSAPTVGREFLKIFASIFANQKSLPWLQVDVSKAFAQSQHLRPKDRLLAIPPLLSVYKVIHGLGWLQRHTR